MNLRTILKMVRKLNPIAYVLIGSGMFSYLVRGDLAHLFQISEQGASFFSAGLVFYGMAILLLNYLSGDRSELPEMDNLLKELKYTKHKSYYDHHSKFETDGIEDRIKSLEEILKKTEYHEYQLPEDERLKILDEIRSSILSDASSSLLTEIENKYSKNIQSERQLNRIKEQLESTRLRLKQEISALGRRGNVNLVIGILTTVAAVAILTNTVFDQNVKITNEALVSHFAPRLTLSLFIEIFSFFFLKLYKSGLTEIKYFQNELTNIEMKFVSLDSAIRFGDDNSTSSVINEFSKTERNFVLDKGQSTVEIERSRLEIDSQNGAISSLSKLFESIKK